MQAATQGTLRAGAAKVDISPEKGIQIAGDIGRRRPCGSSPEARLKGEPEPVRVEGEHCVGTNQDGNTDATDPRIADAPEDNLRADAVAVTHRDRDDRLHGDELDTSV